MIDIIGELNSWMIYRGTSGPLIWFTGADNRQTHALIKNFGYNVFADGGVSSYMGPELLGWHLANNTCQFTDVENMMKNQFMLIWNKFDYNL